MLGQQWGIYDFPFPTEDQPHPCIIISSQTVIENPAYDFINCLLCVSFRPGERLKYFQVRLNSADGLDNATIAKCNQIFHFPKSTMGHRRGLVSYPRRQEIGRKVIEIFGLLGR
jgi:mRNA-degrading endonuclease toxin of MazEF toxin-antitoxin module